MALCTSPLTEYATLDGVMEDPGGAEGFKYGGWTFQFGSNEQQQYKFEELFKADALLLGRRTYEGFAAAWPTMPGTGTYGESIALYMEPSRSWNGEASMTTQNHADTLNESGYIPVNGLEMYYEIHGNGGPLVLLHGNLSTIGTSFGKLLPQLASTRRIIAIEQQGHGHTADIDRPFSIGQWAQDTTALLHHLGIEQADFFGYSSGGAVALETALRSSALVSKLVWAGGTSYIEE